MPTDAEVEAAALAISGMMSDEPWETKRVIACAALAAAEVVRQQAQRDAHAAMNAAYAETHKAILALEVADQRMTQTHTPLGGITATEQAARAAVLADARQREADEAGRRDTAGDVLSGRWLGMCTDCFERIGHRPGCPMSGRLGVAVELAALTGAKLVTSISEWTTSVPQTADTQPARKDYHTSGIPGDGLEMQPWRRTRSQSS